MKLSIAGTFAILSILLLQGYIDGAPHEPIGTTSTSVLSQATVVDDMDGTNTSEVNELGLNSVDLNAEDTQSVTENLITISADEETSTLPSNYEFPSNIFNVPFGWQGRIKGVQFLPLLPEEASKQRFVEKLQQMIPENITQVLKVMEEPQNHLWLYPNKDYLMYFKIPDSGPEEYIFEFETESTTRPNEETSTPTLDDEFPSLPNSLFLIPIDGPEDKFPFELLEPDDMTESEKLEVADLHAIYMKQPRQRTWPRSRS